VVGGVERGRGDALDERLAVVLAVDPDELRRGVGDRKLAVVVVRGLERWLCAYGDEVRVTRANTAESTRGRTVS
jgi:hypothetical protein